MRQRYTTPTELPDGQNEETLFELQTKKSSELLINETESSGAGYEQNKRLGSGASSVISGILRRATSCSKEEKERQCEEDQFPGIRGSVELEQCLYDRVRKGVSFCIKCIFGDSDEAAHQRESVLFDAANRTIDEDYFKGFHQLMVKKLQQSITARKAAPSSTKQRIGAPESTLEELLASAPSLSKSSLPATGASNRNVSVNESFHEGSEFPSPMTDSSIIEDNHSIGDNDTIGGRTIRTDLLPIESAGFLWNGPLAGYVHNTGVAIGMTVWIIPLFRPVPHELRISLRSSLSFSFDRGLSISQFSRHLAADGESTTTRLHVLLGADWAANIPEVHVRHTILDKNIS